MMYNNNYSNLQDLERTNTVREDILRWNTTVQHKL